MKLKTFFLTIFVLLKRRSIALALMVGLLFTVAPMQVLGQSRAYVANVDGTSVSVIDTDPDSPSFHMVLDTIPFSVGSFPWGIAITPGPSAGPPPDVPAPPGAGPPPGTGPPPGQGRPPDAGPPGP